MPRTPEVRVRSADRAERRVPLRAKTTIGRAEDSDIYFPDQLLSRRHAEIELRADGPYIVDLDSTNGTFLNGERLHRDRKLRDGDVIAVGGNTLIFREVDTRRGRASGALLLAQRAVGPGHAQDHRRHPAGQGGPGAGLAVAG